MANRLLLGKHPNFADIRLRISRPGFNVLSTGLTRDQIHFDSTLWNSTLGILATGTVAIPDVVSAPIIDIITWSDPGYIPAFFSYSDEGGIWRLPDFYQWFRIKRTGVDFHPGERMAPSDDKGFVCYYAALASPEGGVIG